MQTGLLYANLTDLDLYATLDGESFDFPSIVAGSALRVQFTLARNVEGTPQPASDVIHALKASLGRVDMRPETGGYKLQLGSADSGNVTSLLQFDAPAATIAKAINALTDGSLSALQPCTVDLDDSTYRIRFLNGARLTGGITCPENALWPVSFVEVTEVQFEGAYIYELRLTEAPVAQVTDFANLVPDPPLITESRAGGSSGGTSWNEIQKLTIPPDFNGAFLIKRGYKATKPIGLPTTAQEVSDALQTIADDLGSFGVTEEQGALLIEFQGSMGGQAQSLLQIQVFDAEAGNPTFILDTNTPSMWALMRRADSNGEMQLTLDLELWLVDPEDDSLYHVVHLQKPVTFIAPVSFDDQNVSANLVWNKPPSGTRYIPFSDSELLIGHRSYRAIVGDGEGLSFVINHDLGTDNVRSSVRVNADGGLELVNGTDYTIAYTNSNSATITFLGSAPATNSVAVTIEGTEQPATYQAHTHPIGEITGLQDILDGFGSSITQLQEALGISGGAMPNVSTPQITMNEALAKIAEVYPLPRGTVVTFDDLTKLDLSLLPSPGGLWPAVHAVTPENITVPLPASSGTLRGRVFQNNTSNDILLNPALKHRAVTLPVGGFAANDGRAWYLVGRPALDELYAGYAFTANPDTDVITITGGSLNVGDRVRLTTTGTLPAPLALNTDYYLIAGLKLSATSGGSAINITDAGSGTHSIGLSPETSFYPLDFERTLFEVSVNDQQFPQQFTFSLQIGLELAVLNANVKAQWVLVIEHGTIDDDTSPARTGLNLGAVTWNPTPMLQQRIILTRNPCIHFFGVSIARSIQIVDSEPVDTLVAQKILYGAASGTTGPATANFAIRGRLIRFDTEDSPAAATGFVAVRGLDASVGSSDTNVSVGVAQIQTTGA